MVSERRRLPIWGLMLMLAAGPLGAAELSLADKLDLLVKSYPDSLASAAGGRLHFKDGSEMAIDDGRTKSHAEALADADIEDMLSQIYPMGPCQTRPAVNFDPGRIRVDALFRRLYGADKQQVRRRLVKINWFGAGLRVNPAQGAAEALRRVQAELAALPARLRKPAMKSAGTFNWRLIAGTKRLSVHSFGAAIDLDVKYANYWRWSGGKPGNVKNYANRIPLEIVDIFERHGFIWGGRWYHYDTMHFEYRPELIAISRALGNDACR
ncbi:MAG: hypothetical protein C0605_09040 [Hyphomicrobiales bacterium]|nr:MAG: hypothetical protein C0605_09040 [Hyphomicrobiales bacterium]